MVVADEFKFSLTTFLIFFCGGEGTRKRCLKARCSMFSNHRHA